MKKLGIYVHVPFCVRKCLYCDFCSVGADRELMTRYANELCRRIEKLSALASDRVVDTVYFGGGTPTLLPVSLFSDILSALRRYFYIEDGAQITVECNPATADLEYLSSLRKMGVDRLSIGLQSVHENELRALGRIHSYDDFLRVYSDAREAGFDNVSVDLMYGIPEQTIDSFRSSIDALIKLRPEHISSYGLNIEERTPFYKMRNSLVLPDEDEEFEMYCTLTEKLSVAGYEKYEISNFALDGKASKHNLRYWRGEEYLGIGVAAYSYFDGQRFGNSRDMDGFLRGEDITEERYVLSHRDEINEYVMLSLRLTEGLSLSKYKELAGEELLSKYPRVCDFVKGGYMTLKDDRLCFTDEGFFISNAILSELFETE